MIVQKKTILHIDDNAQIVRTLADLLEGEGYRVHTSFSAEDGLRKIKQVRPDLLILDMSMPGMSGATVLRRVADAPDGSRPKVLILTAFATTVEDEIKDLADGLMLKPVDINALLEEVKRLIAD